MGETKLYNDAMMQYCQDYWVMVLSQSNKKAHTYNSVHFLIDTYEAQPGIYLH